MIRSGQANNLPLCWHSRNKDNRDGKGHEEHIGDDVTRTHRDKLSHALATSCARVGNDLPVPVKGLTLGQSCYDHSKECHNEKPAYALKTEFVRSLPDLARKALQVF